ncbi:nuclear transport factor 2 family protein [Streptomyces sp. NBC_00249]|uniref:nuclear transport factor 2 family protein n=1 Tax=Streptomyces sp. NBC_00249 TaxID=2975690 RepID=UPI00225A527E|nr:nuclear transport factor 2 family protein [Streptomyces sp. NBC_00249]MCX5194624.1 nuclear transport factor 2 family protein [Streptomyces sp. NBC_00249]
MNLPGVLREVGWGVDIDIDHQALVEAFIELVNEPDDGRRRAGIEALFTEGAEYCDPDVRVEGREELVGHLARLRASFPPGVTFSLTGAVDGHHAQARFGWAFGEQGAPFLDGTDVALFEGTRIKGVYAFSNAA